jgi:hypothetical protein
MGNSWVTDLRHFLNEDGSVAEMPRSTLKLANYFGRIVKAVTSRNKDVVATGIRCRRRPGHKSCSGEIIASIDYQQNSVIVWSCPICGDNGTISGWEGTVWDWSVNA